VSDLLERVHAQTRERLAELLPAAEEYERLQAALAVLDGLTPPRGKHSPASTAQPPARSSGAPNDGLPARRSSRDAAAPPATETGDRRSRAPRGANRAAVLAAVRERPGASAGELAAAAGIARPVVYTLLNRLVERGELVRGQLPSGASGYSPAPEPAAPGWSSGEGDTAGPAEGATPGAEPAAPAT
jgi:hypothetical protein